MLAASVSSWAQTNTPSEPVQGGTLGTVTVTDQAEVQGRDQLQTTRTNIGRGTQDIRDIHRTAATRERAAAHGQAAA